MKRSEQIGELIAALSKAQAEFTPALKDSDNPYYGSKYADLAANINAIRPALSKNGIALLQCDESDLERQTVSVTTSLHHGEQWIEVTAEAPAIGKAKDGLPKFDVQTLGAAWTYLRRYTLQAICGLASEDDDGNSLQNDNKPIPKKQTAPPAPVYEGVFSHLGDRLTCIITGVLEKETKEKHTKFFNVAFNGRIDGFNYATCFDSALFDALRAAKGQECVLLLKYETGDKFINIADVVSINGKPYKAGKPVEEEVNAAAS